MRFLFNSEQLVRKNKIEADRTTSTASLKANVWEIIAAWGTASESFLLMTHFSGVVVKEEREPPTNSLREILCSSELILCDATDLETFGRATPATRSKAVSWLRERGELVATSELRTYPGRMVSQKDALDWIHDTNGWNTTPLGMKIDLRGHVGTAGELVDLEVAASWSPRDTPKPPETPFAEFRHAETTSTGSTLVIEPKTRPDKGPVPVLFLTPHVSTHQEGMARETVQTGPRAGEITWGWYSVHPAFLRKLGGADVAGANPSPHLHPSPPLRPLLGKMGMQFPSGTQIRFIDSDSQVLLIHNAQGHARFQAIINQSGLAIPDRATE